MDQQSWYVIQLFTIAKTRFYYLIVIFACRLVLYSLHACAVENPEISGFCVSKIRAMFTDHRKKIIEM